MARKTRVSVAGIPEHIIQRGNNRQVCFTCEGDMKAYITWLKDYAEKFQVDIHAWVLMTNRVHYYALLQLQLVFPKSCSR